MRNVRWRGPVAAAALSAGLVVAAPSSATPGGAVFVEGVAHIGCFGCGVYGPSGNTFTGRVDGVLLNGTIVDGPVTASYIVLEDPSACPLTGAATGTVTGALYVQFNWTRVGALALVTTTGDIDGFAVAVFVVTSPILNPCPNFPTPGSRPADALVAGVLVGT